MTDIDSEITLSNNVNETRTVLNNPAPVSIAEPVPIVLHEPIPVVHPEVDPTKDIPEPPFPFQNLEMFLWPRYTTS